MFKKTNVLILIVWYQHNFQAFSGLFTTLNKIGVLACILVFFQDSDPNLFEASTSIDLDNCGATLKFLVLFCLI